LSGEKTAFDLDYPCHSPTEQRWFRLFSTPLDEGSLVAHIDITDQKRAEEELRRHQAMMSSAVRIAGVGGWDYDIVHDRLDWDAVTISIFGTKKESFGGTLADFMAFVHPDDREALKEAERAPDPDHKAVDMEYRILRTDGQERVIRDRGEVTFDEGGKPVRSTGVIVDVTEQRRIDIALRRAKEAAEAASLAKSAFLANISHDVRTPMNGIIGFTDLLLGTDLSAEQRDYLEVVKSCSEYLMLLLNDILDFSKIEASQVHVESIRFHLGETLDEVMKSLWPAIKKKNLTFVFESEVSVPDDVFGDPTRLRQILVNLISNAAKFTEKGGVAVRVAGPVVSPSGSILRFSVTDTGIGIPLEVQNAIFRAFSQADTSTTRRYGGTGLGLTIARSLVELMGGRIWVDSKVGEGSTFTFELPLRTQSHT
jgi:PAS domain S-box-containing protein